MSEGSRVVSVNVSRDKGTVQTPVDRVAIDAHGVVGDAHAGPWHRQVSLLSRDEVAAWATRHGRTIEPGAFGENVTLAGPALAEAAPLDRLEIGPVALEVTQIGKACHGTGCSIYQEVGDCIMPRAGVFARVLAGGTVAPGDPVTLHPRTLQAAVLTLSDRAAAGWYEDRSGPAIEAALAGLVAGTRWRLATSRQVLPDDGDELTRAAEAALARGVDFLFTTGSTGLGPRDVAPERVRPLLTKEIPGLMDHVRLRFGAERPGALLSRSLAGVSGRTLVFVLPGSVRAVTEYMSEIGKVLEHLVYTVHGIDRHD
jgi:molybdenum cofactor synthesis domain-containing protein